MSIFRVHKSNNFTVMSNTHFKEKKMSLKAKGLLSLMLSLPDDWNYSVSGLVTLSKDGKDSVMSALAELETFGYLERIRTINNKGQFSGIEYNIFEFPQTDIPITELQNTETPILEETNTEKPRQLNTNKLNNKKNKELIELNTKGGEDFRDILEDIKSIELRDLYIEFIEMRKHIGRPITKRGLKMLINRCERLSNFNIKEQKIMLETSIVNNWSNVFVPNEIKQDREETKQRQIEDLKTFYGVK